MYCIFSNMVKKASASKSVSKVRSGVTNLVLQIQKVTKKSRERKNELVAIEKELSENKKECNFLRTNWFSTKENLRKANESVSTLKKEISNLKSIKTDSNIRRQNNVLVDNIQKRNEKTMALKLASEILAAEKEEGAAVKKRVDVHKMAEANKAFSHFRF